MPGKACDQLTTPKVHKKKPLLGKKIVERKKKIKILRPNKQKAFVELETGSAKKPSDKTNRKKLEENTRGKENQKPVLEKSTDLKEKKTPTAAAKIKPSAVKIEGFPSTYPKKRRRNSFEKKV